MENNHKYKERAAVPQAATKAVRKWQRSSRSCGPRLKNEKKIEKTNWRAWLFGEGVCNLTSS